jgi:hypothetical protein
MTLAPSVATSIKWAGECSRTGRSIEGNFYKKRESAGMGEGGEGKFRAALPQKPKFDSQIAEYQIAEY